jgi:hypothetical protein
LEIRRKAYGAILPCAISVAILASWIVSVVLGVKWAKRNGVSPHWMWFGLHPLGAWIAFPIIRWGSEISQVGNTAVKWVVGKVACPSCGKFTPINSTFCTNCGVAVLKPICPRCKADKTRFVGRVGHYIGWGVLLFFLGAFPLSLLEQSGTGGPMTWGDLIYVLIALPLLIGSLIMFVRPLSRNTKRIKCLSCGTESFVSGITAFQQQAA